MRRSRRVPRRSISRACRVRSSSRSSSLVLQLSTDESHHRPDITNLLRVDGKQIAVEHDEIGKLADLEASLVAFLETRPGAQPRIGLEGLERADRLACAEI